MNARTPFDALGQHPVSTTVFKSGNSQAVRIPKEFQFDAKHVTIRRQGNAIVISPAPRSAAQALLGLPALSAKESADLDQAMALRHDLPPLVDKDLGLATQPSNITRGKKPKASA